MALIRMQIEADASELCLQPWGLIFQQGLRMVMYEKPKQKKEKGEKNKQDVGNDGKKGDRKKKHRKKNNKHEKRSSEDIEENLIVHGIKGNDTLFLNEEMSKSIWLPERVIFHGFIFHF